MPVYGTGENVRDWLYVEDHARALLSIAERGRDGQSYNVGGNCERSNISVVRAICALMDELSPDSVGPRERLITFVTDRPGHDLRYAMMLGKSAKNSVAAAGNIRNRPAQNGRMVPH